MATKWNFLTLYQTTKFLTAKLKVFADNKVNATQKLEFALGRVENIFGKGENLGYQQFLLFPKCFSKASFFRVVKSELSG